MDIKQALKLYPAPESDLLLAHVLNKTREFLYLHPDKKLTKTEERRFRILTKRRMAGEPYAYIVGYKYFCGLKVKVNKNVLIPRPETEWLVEQARTIIKQKLEGKKKRGSLKILDLGTGSGCIAISLYSQLPSSERKRVSIYASDISGQALKIAKINAKAHKTRIKFIKSDLLTNVFEKFDVIIANLPYVPLRDYAKLKANLKYEPKLALTDGTNTGEIYNTFLKQAVNNTVRESIILLEIDPTQKKPLEVVTKQIFLPTYTISFFKDFNNLWRYGKIRLNKKRLTD